MYENKTRRAISTQVNEGGEIMQYKRAKGIMKTSLLGKELRDPKKGFSESPFKK